MTATTNSTSIAATKRRRRTPVAAVNKRRRWYCWNRGFLDSGSQPEAAGLAPVALRDKQVTDGIGSDPRNTHLLLHAFHTTIAATQKQPRQSLTNMQEPAPYIHW
jgi:hypothetical protein